MKAPSSFAHLRAIVLLPFFVTVVIPIILTYLTNDFYLIPFKHLKGFIFYSLGLFFSFIGILLFIQSIILFHKIGKGTLAPWDPTKNLIVKGLYRYHRNPMITGVLCILIAEAIWLKSFYIFCWALLFFLVNHFYFILSEEPGLVKRFGEEYVEYKNNVPRWIPRLKPWRPEDSMGL